MDSSLGLLDTLMKTNRQWYFYEDQGACFKLINGELWMCSPNIDHTPDETDACFLPEEEWYENEPMTRDQMIKDLEEKE
jgi:hypothetical protein